MQFNFNFLHCSGLVDMFSANQHGGVSACIWLAYVCNAVARVRALHVWIRVYLVWFRVLLVCSVFVIYNLFVSVGHALMQLARFPEVLRLVYSLPASRNFVARSVASRLWKRPLRNLTYSTLKFMRSNCGKSSNCLSSIISDCLKIRTWAFNPRELTNLTV